MSSSRMTQFAMMWEFPCKSWALGRHGLHPVAASECRNLWMLIVMQGLTLQLLLSWISACPVVHATSFQYIWRRQHVVCFALAAQYRGSDLRNGSAKHSPSGHYAAITNHETNFTELRKMKKCSTAVLMHNLYQENADKNISIPRRVWELQRVK